MKQIILGTAGHIDHGKTSLIRAVTGTDTDRLKEEKERLRLKKEEAKRLYAKVIRNIEIFLSLEMVHADLSAYNIIYWLGDIKVIDMPQTVDGLYNSNAFELLKRDVYNVFNYFARFGVEGNPLDVVFDLWDRYIGRAI